MREGYITAKLANVNLHVITFITLTHGYYTETTAMCFLVMSHATGF